MKHAPVGMAVLALSLIIVANASQVGIAEAAPKPPPAAKPSGRHQAAMVSPEIRAAVENGPTDLLVTFDPDDGLRRMRVATRSGFDSAHRAAAVRAGAAAFTAAKRMALAQVGAGVTTRRDYDHLPVQLIEVASPEALARLASTPGVSSLELPRRRTLEDVPPDLSLIHQPEAVRAGYTRRGLDGCRAGHGRGLDAPWRRRCVR
jgi:hypothetical protein